MLALEDKLRDAQLQLKRVKRDNTLLKNKLVSAVEARVGADIATDNELALAITTQNTRLTTRGVVALGIRKGLTATSAVSFPLTALVDVKRWTVCRSENIVWSILVARTVCFHRIWLKVLRQMAEHMKGRQAHRHSDPTTHQLCQRGEPHSSSSSLTPTLSSGVPSEDQMIEQDLGFPSIACLPFPTLTQTDTEHFLVGGTLFSTDATNTSMWRRHKLQAVLVESNLLTNRDLLSSSNAAHAFVRHRAVLLGVNSRTQRYWFSLVLCLASCVLQTD